MDKPIKVVLWIAGIIAIILIIRYAISWAKDNGYFDKSPSSSFEAFETMN